MKLKFLGTLLCCLSFMTGCDKSKSTESGNYSLTKEILLQQLKTTHSKKEWYVPVNDALEGLTSEQAMWRDSSGNHSIGQLAYHLYFWNARQLAKLKGHPEEVFSGNNEETFTTFNQVDWEKTVKQVDRVLIEMEKIISEASEEKLEGWYPTLANISTHNGYHTGQIIYIRKMKGWWDPEKGVK
ncbi:MAG: DinB family protein [Chryseolinea sp.]